MNELYGIIKQVIESKDYKLSEITGRIEKRCFEGRISEEERDELLTMANQNASADKEKAAMQNQIDALFGIVGELALEIKALKEGAGEAPEETPEETEEYPQWQRWNGIDKIPYQEGSKCTHNGRYYLSHVNNNFWEPGALGVYENIWEDVTDQVLAEV